MQTDRRSAPTLSRDNDKSQEIAIRCEQNRMSSHPSCVDRFVEEPMAVEPTNVNENAAALQEPAPEGLLTDADLEGSPAKKRKVRKQVCTLMCMNH